MDEITAVGAINYCEREGRAGDGGTKGGGQGRELGGRRVGECVEDQERQDGGEAGKGGERSRGGTERRWREEGGEEQSESERWIYFLYMSGQN